MGTELMKKTKCVDNYVLKYKFYTMEEDHANKLYIL